MKYYIRTFLALCLLSGLTSCTLLPQRIKKKGGDLTPLVTMSPLDPAKGQISTVLENKGTVGGRRRSIAGSSQEAVSSIEKDLQKGIDEIKGEKSKSIFKPFMPEKEGEEGALGTGEEGLPAEITKELISQGEKEEEYVTLNFEQAPIEQILNAVSETLSINFIMTPGVKGTITMQTSKAVPASELFQILQSVLEVNGLTLVPSGRYYKVVPGKDAKQYPIQVLSGKEGEELPYEDSFITQIIPLEYIPVKDMISILQPFLSKSAPAMIQHDELNILIINDLSSNMKRLLKFVQELDKPLYQPKEKVYVYYVENGDADKLAGTLNAIYKKTDKNKKFPFQGVGEKPDAQTPQQAQQQQQVIQTPFGPFVPQEQVTGDVNVTADKEINALIIVTSPRDYPSVLETIKKLDIAPKQALIEAMIVDVTLTDQTELGIGWYLKGHDYLKGNLQTFGQNVNNLPLSGGDVDPTAFSSIFGYKIITDSGRFSAFISQLSKMTKLNVVSSPYIMALDNKKATINITDELPITRLEYPTANATQPVTSYEYKSVGLKLEVTPKINESNMLTLEISQEVSEAELPSKVGDPFNAHKRTATSNVVVKDGQTIIIGGLIQNKLNKTKAGIPFLSDIPVIGKLFGGSMHRIEKKELLIFITPHVVANQEQAKELTTEFKNKVESIKELTRSATETK